MTATADRQTALHDFEGRAVQRATVKITNAGDGLSASLDIEPEEIELEDRRFYVLEGECVRVSVETDAHGVTSRVHTIKTQGISKVEPAVAKEMLAKAAEELERKKAERDGQLMLQAEADAEERERADLASTGAQQIPQPNFSQPQTQP